MLYVTTRDNRDAYTAYRALHEKRGADGGGYVPFRGLRFSEQELEKLLEKSFGQCTAEILNLLFGAHLTGWDVDFAIGRKPVRLKGLGHRVIMAETWHNSHWSFDNLMNNIGQLLSKDETVVSAGWVRIAIRTAVLFGLFAELKRGGIESPLDAACISGDFSATMSLWYARAWGLPIENIVCCCNENGGIWDLFCNGQMRTDGVSVPTDIPEADVVVPQELERLIFAMGGTEEVQRYLDACQTGKTYMVSEDQLQKLRRGMYVSVVSTHRAMETIPGIYWSHGYLLSSPAALSYAGLMDYRAKKGGTRNCIILSEKSPMCDGDVVAKALGISVQNLKTICNS